MTTPVIPIYNAQSTVKMNEVKDRRIREKLKESEEPPVMQDEFFILGIANPNPNVRLIRTSHDGCNQKRAFRKVFPAILGTQLCK